MSQPSDSPTLRLPDQHLQAGTVGKSEREQAAIVENDVASAGPTTYGSAKAGPRRTPVPPWLAQRRTRRLLALSPVLPLLFGLGAAATTGGVSLGLVFAYLTSGLVLWILLRRATAQMADATDDLLDEREAGERDASYRHAFPHVLGLILLVPLTQIAQAWTGITLVTGDGWRTLGTTIFVTAALLPSAVVAWRWREPDDPRD